MPRPAPLVHTPPRLLENVKAKAYEIRISDGCYVYKLRLQLEIQYRLGGMRKIRRELFESSAFAYSVNDESCYFGREIGANYENAFKQLLDEVNIFLGNMGFPENDIANATAIVEDALRHREIVGLSN